VELPDPEGINVCRKNRAGRINLTGNEWGEGLLVFSLIYPVPLSMLPGTSCMEEIEKILEHTTLSLPFLTKKS